MILLIKSEDILSLNFYKKEKFTGSYQGMRYLIQKDSEETKEIFRVYAWPGPYNYETTDNSLKKTAVFPFTLEGKQLAVDFLNEQWLDFQSKNPYN